MFDSVDPKQSFPDLELGILKYWREEDTFKRSMHRREKGEVFSFYDGPPFATGLPHYGHILAGTIKDVIPRYQTMRGKYVKRRFGWDCHGLPVENEIEKEKGLTSKKDIECLGIGCFNDLCRTAVQRYTKEWRSTVERLGRFVDMDWDYRTMDPDYMESIWWVFKQLHQQKLIYEGRKAMHICPRCVTPLSNFEVTQGYKDVDDLAVTWKFALKETNETNEKTYILAWTTTPWSTLSTMGLSIKADATYVKIRTGKESVVVAKDRATDIMKGIKEYEIVEEFPGSKLVGATYTHIAPWYAEVPEIKANTNVYHIFAGDYVETSEGTGIVTINGSYGEVDMEAAKKNGLPILMDVDMDGRFNRWAGKYAGMEVKEAQKKIVEDMKKANLVWRKESYRHSYPHCWRCDTPLLNYATSSWFVAVEKIKETMLKSNAQTQWVPSHLRDGRFGKWLEGARDWAISRNRFWGTPLPIWRNTVTGEIEVIGSRDELMTKAPTRFTKVFISRHAESQGNVDKIYQCKEPSTPLTDTGEKQAAALGSRVKEQTTELPIKTIYCSPLRRTRETAEAIAKATGATVIVDERLREVDFGEYEGKHVDFDDLTFVRERRAHKLEQGQVESIYHFHGMETWTDVGSRVESFLKEILPKHRGEAISIVTHADPIMNITHFFTGQDPHKIVHQPYPGLASLRTFYWDHERNAQMDLHKETVDGITWGNQGSGIRDQAKGKKSATRDSSRGGQETNTVEVTLVRHGETDMNKQGLVQGSEIDMPLNATGQTQAKAAAASLKGERFDAILSSDLKRAVETATIIAKETGIRYAGSNVLLRERNVGKWSRQPVDEIRKILNDPTSRGICFTRTTPPDGEPFEQFVNRARLFYDFLLKNYAGKRVLLVGHSGFLQAFKMIITGVTYEEMPMKRPKNAHPEALIIRPQLRNIDVALDPNTVQVTLVRHGETALNKLDLMQGSEIDPPLNAIGKTQAKTAGTALKGQPYDVIISSDLKRAVDTAKILGKETDVPLAAPNPLVRERNLGEWSKKPIEEMKQLISDPGGRGFCFSRVTPPNGEPFEQLMNRARLFHDFLLKEHAGKRVIVVSHMGFLQAFKMVATGVGYEEMPMTRPRNAHPETLTLRPQLRRIDEVLDCWFESGSMPYAQDHFPFEVKSDSPVGFPADFIAEGLDQTRGWFYTLTVLSSALFKCPAFKNCIVNGIVLAEDGKKMSKRLKNYPEPTEVVKKHGADAVRFALMASPAVRGEDLRFSEKLVEETVRSVLLPLWNTYRLFVTYANASGWKPSIDFSLKNAKSQNQLDRWIIIKTQELVNNMTAELDGYDLSATCAHLAGSIDDLTNWYVRLSRRRFAAKQADNSQADAMDTLYRVLIANCQLLAPFCPFLTEAIYLNLVEEDHGSIHFTDWPVSAPIDEDDQKLLQLMDNTRQIVSLGLSLRSDAKIRVRQPLQSVTFALPPSDTIGVVTDLIKEELNVKQVIRTTDASALASSIVQVDARKVGPRLGKKVQEVIKAGKEGKFEEKDGAIIILGERLTPEEAKIIHQSKEGQTVAANRGIVVTLDTTMTDTLKSEATARELIHAIQVLRKDAGLEFTDTIKLSVEGAGAVLEKHGAMIAEETRAELTENTGKKETVTIDGEEMVIRFEKK